MAINRKSSHFHSMIYQERRFLNDDEFVPAFNLKLDALSSISDLNERAIEDLLSQLDGYPDLDEDIYWLSLARINELALLCAGNYADSCEFRLVGDFLLNPRRILINVPGSRHPVIKIRHMALGEQFRHMADSPLGVIQWLKLKTSQKIEEEALLPHLYGLLKCSGRLVTSYLDSVVERKTRLAALTGFLASSGFKDGEDFYRWMKSADPADRSLVEKMLCRFDHRIFLEMGEDIRLLAEDPTWRSRFLV